MNLYFNIEKWDMLVLKELLELNFFLMTWLLFEQAQMETRPSCTVIYKCFMNLLTHQRNFLQSHVFIPDLN